ncbi:hypothetical protein RRG08_017414 [Elysia crispata]|uniref:Uncharacterized protein n=1 Tax=Elysia crispata TaxID=231223 RepID=A0AAE0ZNW3_9GAST|nr:hypothetical protein RRG08_017414 [Elysia crispata]
MQDSNGTLTFKIFQHEVTETSFMTRPINSRLFCSGSDLAEMPIFFLKNTLTTNAQALTPNLGRRSSSRSNYNGEAFWAPIKEHRLPSLPSSDLIRPGMKGTRSTALQPSADILQQTALTTRPLSRQPFDPLC